MNYTLNLSLDESESIGKLFNISDEDVIETLQKYKINGKTPGGAIREILKDDTLSDEHKIFYLIIFGFDQGTSMEMRD